MGGISIDTTYTGAGEKSYTFKIGAVGRAIDLPKAFDILVTPTISVRLGCFECTTITASVKADNTMADYVSFKSNTLRVLTYLNKKSNETRSFNLLDILKFSTDIDGCGPYKVESYTNKERSIKTATTHRSHLKVNPTVREGLTNVFNPVIEYIAASTQLPLLYLTVFTDTNKIVTTPAKLDLIVDLSVCLLKPTPFTSSVVENNLVQHAPASNTDLNSLFTYDVSIPECNGKEYLITSDSAGKSPITVPIISLSVASVKLDPTVPGVYDFYVVYNATKSLEIGVIQYKITVKPYCLNQTLSKSSSNFELTYTLQKNTLNGTSYI